MKYSYEVLREATAQLKAIIEAKFDEVGAFWITAWIVRKRLWVIIRRTFQAVQSDDVASLQRFFKLFPLINEHSGGINRFGHYLCEKTRAFAEDNYKVILQWRFFNPICRFLVFR